MKNMCLSIIIIAFLLTAVNAFSKDIIITLTQEQYDAMTVLTVTPEEWLQNAADVKANKMIEVLITEYSDKQFSKISESEKKVIFNTIDLEKERNDRRGKKR